jgi:hypothetical protein
MTGLPGRQAEQEVRSRHMIAGEGLVAVRRMIVAYRRGDGAATSYVIAWVAVALQYVRVGDDVWARIDPVHRWP